MVALVYVHGLHVSGDLREDWSLDVAVDGGGKLDRPRRAAARNVRHQHMRSARGGLSKFRRLALNESLLRQHQPPREAETEKHCYKQDDREQARGPRLIAALF